jgi:hypothetical protein
MASITSPPRAASDRTTSTLFLNITGVTMPEYIRTYASSLEVERVGINRQIGRRIYRKCDGATSPTGAQIPNPRLKVDQNHEVRSYNLPMSAQREDTFRDGVSHEISVLLDIWPFQAIRACYRPWRKHSRQMEFRRDT